MHLSWKQYQHPKYTVIEQGGRSHIQYLLWNVSEYKYIKWHRSCQHNDSMSGLFWAHPIDIDSFYIHFQVLLLWTAQIRHTCITILLSFYHFWQVFPLLQHYHQPKRKGLEEGCVWGWEVRELGGKVDGWLKNKI